MCQRIGVKETTSQHSRDGSVTSAFEECRWVCGITITGEHPLGSTKSLCAFSRLRATPELGTVFCTQKMKQRPHPALFAETNPEPKTLRSRHETSNLHVQLLIAPWRFRWHQNDTQQHRQEEKTCLVLWLCLSEAFKNHLTAALFAETSEF